MLPIIAAIVVSYLVGSIPTAYIFCKALKDVDIRTVGSGNVGATNALRVLGKRWGITILILDMLKGALPVVFLANYFLPKTPLLNDEQLRVLIGFCCISGHNWTIFLNFKGGKGVATSIGVLAGLAFTIPGLNIILGILLLTWLIAFLLFRIVSLASIIAFIELPVLAALFKESKFIICASLVLSLFAVIRHKTNIARLMQGKEPRLNFKKH
jgi:glycerol-3-phosphate acyltransferase PlsY